MSIAHYPIGESCGRAWLTEMVALSDEAALEPLHEPEQISRVVSRDAICGCAPMESEAVIA